MCKPDLPTIRAPRNAPVEILDGDDEEKSEGAYTVCDDGMRPGNPSAIELRRVSRRRRKDFGTRY